MNKIQIFKNTLVKSIVFIAFGTVFTVHAQQKEAPSWIDFAEKKLTNNLAEATLNDYSFSGYHFSEKDLPNVSGWNTLDVTNYGAVPNDTGYDDASIQAAIDAAEASNVPTVVFFPAGKYMVSSETTKTKPIIIRGSNIVLKGAGTGTGGTEIYADKFNENKFGNGSTHYRFMFIPSSTSSSNITQVTSEIKKGDFEIQVASATNLSVGQYVDLYQSTTANLDANMPGLTINPDWSPILNNGIRPYEKHEIVAILGNKVTFKNPVQLNMPLSSTTVLKTFQTITEVGVEDILFTSGWKDYPEDFFHHANDIVDYAWQAVYFSNVVNGWIKNCNFKDWNEGVFIDKSLAVTVKDIEISGKKGHTSYYSRYSYGVLFENCVDSCSEGLSKDSNLGMHHGPGMRWSTTSTVFANCTMQQHQSIDCHGFHPYGNLLDNIKGGTVRANGGAANAYPNSGPYLTFWNFKHNSKYSNKTFDFWDSENRKLWTFANPNFIGFQERAGENITFQNEGIDELRNEQVYPNSLFDAQLQLRLYDGYMSASSSKESNQAKLANDNNEVTFWESEIVGAGQWLMLDLGVDKTIENIILKEPTAKIKDWKLEYWDVSEWKELEIGSGIGAEKQIAIGLISARKIRLEILSMLSGQEFESPSISEFKVIPTLELAPDNFTIQAIGETCKDKNNGKLIINAETTHNYIASINDINYEFTNSLTIVDLLPGTYDLCIETEGTTSEQCYNIAIAAGESLLGKISVNEKTAKVSVTSGDSPYKVIKNGELIYETNQSDFSIEINQGDHIQVQGKDACQGELLKTVDLLDEIIVYPNPSKGIFEFHVPDNIGTIELEVYNVQSQLIVSKTYNVKIGKVQLNLEKYPNGVYFLKVNSAKPVFVKLIKQ